MPTGTRPAPNYLDEAIAAIIRAAMARKTPAVKIYQLAEMADVDPSTLSRLLKPTRIMTVQQLDAICRALGLNTGNVLSEAVQVVAEYEADKLRKTSSEPRKAVGQ